MTDIEEKALEQVKEMAALYARRAFATHGPHLSGHGVIIGFDNRVDASDFFYTLLKLDDFIPKPDPLVAVAESLGYFNTSAHAWANDARAALEAQGLEVKEKGQ